LRYLNWIRRPCGPSLGILIFPAGLASEKLDLRLNVTALNVPCRTLDPALAEITREGRERICSPVIHRDIKILKMKGIASVGIASVRIATKLENHLGPSVMIFCKSRVCIIWHHAQLHGGQGSKLCCKEVWVQASQFCALTHRYVTISSAECSPLEAVKRMYTISRILMTGELVETVFFNGSPLTIAPPPNSLMHGGSFGFGNDGVLEVLQNPVRAQQPRCQHLQTSLSALNQSWSYIYYFHLMLHSRQGLERGSCDSLHISSSHPTSSLLPAKSRYPVFKPVVADKTELEDRSWGDNNKSPSAQQSIFSRSLWSSTQHFIPTHAIENLTHSLIISSFTRNNKPHR